MTDIIKGFKILAIIFSFSFVGFANESPFRVTSFEEAEKIAKKENKPLLVDFYAIWCGPCKWMDETTFSDDKIRKILKEDYISIKINIDDFDGYELKSRYEVRYLPTIIIFKNGRVVERLEETVGVIKMNNLLNQHKSPTSAVVKKVATNTNPKDKAVASNFTENLTLDEINSNFNSLNHVYKLQLGVFAKKDGATKLVNELSTKVFEQPLILQDYRNNTIIYKVIIGEFHSLNDAEQFKSQLSSDHKVESFILRM